ncbi:hypothetical protein GH714_011074 [Hevea brasiliensis]|uniref:Uncharacterized protein n=1 Tax=Hevea brasiliensis TaxID=3981 RepID=A0A6A6N2E7_HEVBR|nr:hypothetical protein GH714_011074 [Hevea brasiliensis]
MGHFASECSSKEKEEQANLTERDDEDQSLLMIETCELNGQSYGQIYFEEPSLMMIDAVELNGVQGEAYVAATSGCLMKGAGWYLDTGATNHMTGDKHCFVEIDDSICGKVKFGDGSVIDIQGFGSVMFQCKNGEHLTLTNVYYIPKLKSNIISLGQIDESGGRILIECGALRVYDNSNRLIIKKEEDDVTVVGVYVDDLILTGSNGKHIESFKQEMMRMFEMSDLGLLSYYLGIEVKQTPDCISLCQAGYASKILEKTGMLNCNSSRVPMEPKCKLKKQDGEPFVDATEYRRIIGSLRYLVNTRPDLAYSVGVVSRYMDTPTVTHMSAVKQILRYVRGTIGMGIVYKKNQEKEELVGFSDSDLAGDTDDRKSTSGIIFFFGESPITWVSHKQRIVALSSCEAEYIAATGGACQGIWLKKIIAELRGDDKVKPVLKSDIPTIGQFSLKFLFCGFQFSSTS